ncbi:hypothetical protein BJX70DRAFT_18040 [Aspergillus crustosus]
MSVTMDTYISTTSDAFRSHLEDLFQSDSNNPSQILRTILKESKSLPRETDMDPTSPRPDQPSAPQEGLLELIRENQPLIDLGEGEGEGVGSGNGSSKGKGREKGKERDSGVGLDELADRGDRADEGEEEYFLLREIIQSSFPRATQSPSEFEPSEESIFADHTRRSSIPEQDRTTTTTTTTSSPPFSPPHSRFLHRFSFSGSPSHPHSPTSPTSTYRQNTHHRRTSSSATAKEGEAKQFYNLISFLAFLTKERLLLHPGIGEKVAVEMVHDTLRHSESPEQRRYREQNQQPGQGYTPWFGCGDGTSITAISLFLIIMGEELYQRVLTTSASKSKSTSTYGRKDDGLPKLVSQNWETWRSRLQFLSLREDLGIGAREQAAEAAAVMGRV